MVDVELLPKFCCVILEPGAVGAGVGGFQIKKMMITKARAMTMARIRLSIRCLLVDILPGVDAPEGEGSGMGSAGSGIVRCCSSELWYCGFVV